MQQPLSAALAGDQIFKNKTGIYVIETGACQSAVPPISS